MVWVTARSIRKLSLIIAILCLLYTYMNWTYIIKTKDWIYHSAIRTMASSDVGDVNMERRNRIHRVCSANEKELRRNKSMYDHSSNMYIDENHNITYCHLFKSAFTFWSLLFQIVRGDVKATSPFDPALFLQRGRHIRSLQTLPYKQQKEFFDSSFSFMFTRDPYSRLLSGYTDKLFMPNNHWRDVGPSMAQVVRQHSQPCVHDLQFNEFIKYVIHSEENRYGQNVHYAFAFDYCDPCQYKYDFIGKLETIKQDTKYLLEKMNQTEVSLNLEKDFKGQYTRFTIKERIDMLFKSNGSKYICNVTFFQLQRKIWKGFQMNGIISKESKYPVTEKMSNTLTAETFRDMVFSAVGDAADDIVSRRNKAEAFLEAYSTVDAGDMDKLSRLLQPDCQVFGYNCRPRKLFEDRKYIKPWYFDITTA